MRQSDRTKWGLCFGLMGALIVGGAATVGLVRPASAQTTPTPTEGGDQLAQGRQVFARACGRCHPGGEEDIGPRIINKNEDEPRMLKQIRQGSGRMRAVPPTKLPDANMPALMAYLRSIHAVH